MQEDDATDAKLKQAEALIELGRTSRAIDLLATIPQTSPRLVAGVNCLLARALLSLGRNEEALRCARAAVEAEPNSDEPLYWLALVEPDASAQLRHALRLVELDPEWAPYRSIYALALRRNKRNEEAVAVAREAARQAPDSILVLTLLGDILKSTGSEDAAQAYGRILEIDPDHVRAREALADLKRIDNIDESARMYASLLVTDPDRTENSYRLNWMVFSNLLHLCAGTMVGYAIASLVTGVVYALGNRRLALVAMTVWSLILVRSVFLSFKRDFVKLGEGLGISPRDAFVRLYEKLPVSSIVATCAAVMITLPPLIWAVFGLVGRAPSWWAAVGVPVLIMACRWGAATFAWLSARRRGR